MLNNTQQKPKLVKVKPATSVPFFFEILTEPKEFPSSYDPSGREWYIEGFLIEGNTKTPACTYVAPEAFQAIYDCDAKLGDTIRLLKLRGNRGWECKKIGEAQDEEPPFGAGPQPVEDRTPAQPVLGLAPQPTYTQGQPYQPRAARETRGFGPEKWSVVSGAAAPAIAQQPPAPAPAAAAPAQQPGTAAAINRTAQLIEEYTLAAGIGLIEAWRKLAATYPDAKLAPPDMDRIGAQGIAIGIERSKGGR